MSCLYCGKSTGLFKRSKFCSPEHEQLFQEQESLMVQRLLDATLPEAPVVPLSLLINPPEPPPQPKIEVPETPAPQAVEPVEPVITSPPLVEKVEPVETLVPVAASADTSSAPAQAGFFGITFSTVDLRRHDPVRAHTRQTQPYTRYEAPIAERAEAAIAIPRALRTRVDLGARWIRRIARSLTGFNLPPAPTVDQTSETPAGALGTTLKSTVLRLNAREHNLSLASSVLKGLRLAPAADAPQQVDQSTGPVTRASFDRRHLVVPRRDVIRTLDIDSELSAMPEPRTASLPEDSIPTVDVSLRAWPAVNPLTLRARPALVNAFAPPDRAIQLDPRRRRGANAWRTGNAPMILAEPVVLRALRPAFASLAAAELRVTDLALAVQNSTRSTETVLWVPAREENLSLAAGLRILSLAASAPAVRSTGGKPSPLSQGAGAKLQVQRRGAQFERKVALPQLPDAPARIEAQSHGLLTIAGRRISELTPSLERRVSAPQPLFAPGSASLSSDGATIVETRFPECARSETFEKLASLLPRLVSSQPLPAQPATSLETHAAFFERAVPENIPLAKKWQDGPSCVTSVRRERAVMRFTADPAEPNVQSATASSVNTEISTRTIPAHLLSVAQRSLRYGLGAVTIPPAEQHALPQYDAVERLNARALRLLDTSTIFRTSAATRIAIPHRGADRTIASGTYVAGTELARPAQSIDTPPMVAPHFGVRAYVPAGWRVKPAPANQGYSPYAAPQVKPRVQLNVSSTWSTVPGPPLLTPRIPEKVLRSSELLQVRRESNEIFTPTVYIHGLALPNTSRLAVKRHGLLRLPTCRAMEPKGFGVIDTGDLKAIRHLALTGDVRIRLSGSTPKTYPPLGQLPVGRRISRLEDAAGRALRPRVVSQKTVNWPVELAASRFVKFVSDWRQRATPPRSAEQSPRTAYTASKVHIVRPADTTATVALSQRSLRVRPGFTQRVSPVFVNGSLITLPVSRGRVGELASPEVIARQQETERSAGMMVRGRDNVPAALTSTFSPELRTFDGSNIIFQGDLNAYQHPTKDLAELPSSTIWRHQILRSAQNELVWRTPSVAERWKSAFADPLRASESDAVLNSALPASGVSAQIPLTSPTTIWIGTGVTQRSTLRCEEPALIRGEVPCSTPGAAALSSHHALESKFIESRTLTIEPKRSLCDISRTKASGTLGLPIHARPLVTEAISQDSQGMESAGVTRASQPGRMWETFKVGAPLLPWQSTIRPDIAAMSDQPQASLLAFTDVLAASPKESEPVVVEEPGVTEIPAPEVVENESASSQLMWSTCRVSRGY